MLKLVQQKFQELFNFFVQFKHLEIANLLIFKNFFPDGNTLASCSRDKTIRLWDVKTGQQKAKLVGHTKNVKQICFSPDGNTLASGSDDNSIRLWEIKNKYCSDYRFKEIQFKNTRYPFLNTPLQKKNIIQNLDTFNIMVYPDFNFSKFKRVVYKKPFPFRRIIGVYSETTQFYFFIKQ